MPAPLITYRKPKTQWPRGILLRVGSLENVAKPLSRDLRLGTYVSFRIY